MRERIPFTQDDADTLRRLHGEGLPRNTIAKRMGRGAGTITYHAQKMGLAFDRSLVVAALAARKVDIAERRANIAEEMLKVAEEALRECQQQYKATLMVQTTGEWSERVFDRPPPRERLDLVKIAGLSAVNSMKLTDFDRERGDDADADRAILLNLSDALQRATGT